MNAPQPLHAVWRTVKIKYLHSHAERGRRQNTIWPLAKWAINERANAKWKLYLYIIITL